MTEDMGLYARDGLCHNAEPGTYGHECGKPADWLGQGTSGSWVGYCDDCRQHGYEARNVKAWQRHARLEAATSA